MENNIPQFEYAMLNTIHDALQKEYDRYKKASGINQQLATVAKDKGLAYAKQCEDEARSNHFTPLGQIWSALERTEEIREAISAHVTG